MTRTTRKVARALALASVATLSLSACGGGDSSSSSDEIRLMAVGVLTPAAAFGGISFPYGVNGVKAAAAAINKSGGIDGKMIKVDTCDTKGDPNQSAQCGRTAAENKDIAVVGTFDPLGAKQLVTVLQAEKIPYVGGLPTSTAEYASPISFQFDPGPILASSATPQLWKDSGCTQVASILPANPGNDEIATQEKAQAQDLGLGITTALIKPGTADVTPALSTALSSKPDCFTYGGDAQTNVKFILGLKKLGFTGKIITSSGSLTPQFLAPLGDAATGIIVLGSALQPSSDDPLVQQWIKEMAATLSKKDLPVNLNEFAQDGWSSVQLVKQALEKAKKYDAQALLDTIPTMCDVNIGTVYPHLNFCKPVSDSKLTPRVYNDQWRYFSIENGQYAETDGQWHDDSSLMQ